MVSELQYLKLQYLKQLVDVRCCAFFYQEKTFHLRVTEIIIIMIIKIIISDAVV